MAYKQPSSGPFKMMGSSPAKAKEKTGYSEAAKNLLKAVPDEAAYNKLSDIDKKGFDAAGKKAGLPQKRTPVKQRPLTKEEKAGNKKEEEKYKRDAALVWDAETLATKKAENTVRKIEATKAAIKKDKAYNLKQRKVAYREALEEYYSKMDETDGKYKGKRPVL